MVGTVAAAQGDAATAESNFHFGGVPPQQGSTPTSSAPTTLGCDDDTHIAPYRRLADGCP